MKRTKVLVFAVVVAGVLLYLVARPDKDNSGDAPVQADAKFLTEDMKLAGEAETLADSDLKLKESASPLAADEGIPKAILEEMKQCLGVTLPDEDPTNSRSKSKPVLMGLEEALANLEKDLGPPLAQGDLWTDWIVRLPEGLDRKIHLENVEKPEGGIQQSLSVFEIDQSGKANRIHIAASEETNPDMGVVFAMINSGEVQRKETSRFYQYAGGERLELIELNGKPTELEIVKDEIFFRCDEMKDAENCHCIR